MKLATTFPLVLAGSLSVAGSAHAVTLLDDGFDDGGFTNGADALDTDWYARGSTPALSVEPNDTVSGLTGNALFFNTDPSGTSGNFERFLGNFDDQDADANLLTELEIGDVLSLSADIRLTTAPDAFAGIRFGLYNSNGTRQTTNNSFGNSGDLFSGIGDDIGYFVRFNPGIAGTGDGDIYYEINTDGSILGGSDDQGQIGTDFDTPALGTSAATLAMSIERLNADDLGITFSVNGSGVASRTDFDAETFAFDQVVFGTGNADFDFYVDNIAIEYTPIPEPASAGLVIAGLLVMASSRRR